MKLLPVLGLGAVLGLAACAQSGPPPARVSVQATVPVSADTTCGIPQFRDTLVRYVNAARAAARTCGGQRVAAARPVAWDGDLAKAASKHSLDMASRNYFSHNSPEGGRVHQRAKAAGYEWRAIGENLAGGDTSVDAVMAGWLGSESHCRNLMNPAYEDVAVACVRRPGTAWETYWTLVLGRRG